jgi:DnaK suppressor protein
VMHALDRIVRGVFGKCEACGEAISAERLEALPYTAYCLHCEQNLESR